MPYFCLVIRETKCTNHTIPYRLRSTRPFFSKNISTCKSSTTIVVINPSPPISLDYPSTISFRDNQYFLIIIQRNAIHWIGCTRINISYVLIAIKFHYIPIFKGISTLINILRIAIVIDHHWYTYAFNDINSFVFRFFCTRSKLCDSHL